MTVIEREQRTVGWMIELYCRAHHHTAGGLCGQCSELLEFAKARLMACRYGEKKGSCRKCPTHCYRKDMRERIREVMRYSGPRMILHHPIAAIRHILR